MTAAEDITRLLSAASHSNGVTRATYLAHARSMMAVAKEESERLERMLGALEAEMVRTEAPR